MYTYICIYIQTYMHTSLYIHTYIRTYMHTYIRPRRMYIGSPGYFTRPGSARFAASTSAAPATGRGSFEVGRC